MHPCEPAAGAHSLDGAPRNPGFVLEIQIFNTLEALAFLSSLITCLGQSTCSFLANILLWRLDISFNDFNCSWVPPACLTSSFEQQDKYLISAITGEAMSGSKAGSWGLGWGGFGPPGFNASHRWGLTVMDGHSTQTRSSA